jgi:hypothetical protein
MQFYPDDTDNGVLGVFDSAGTLISHQYLRQAAPFTLSYSYEGVPISYILAGFHDPARLGPLTFEVAPVPEPSTYALLLVGLALLAFMARRRVVR